VLIIIGNVENVLLTCFVHVKQLLLRKMIRNFWQSKSMHLLTILETYY